MFLSSLEDGVRRTDTIDLYAGAQIDNAVGGVFDIASSSYQIALQDSSTVSFNNAGTLEEGMSNTGSVVPFNGVVLNNTGTVAVSEGTLQLNDGGSSTGTWNADGGGIDFNGGTFNVNSGSVLESSGTGAIGVSGSAVVNVATGQTIGDLQISGGVLNLSAQVNAGSWSFTGGTVEGTGTLNVTGTGNWNNNNGMEEAALEVASGATLTISSNASVSGATLTNDGTVDWTNGSIDRVRPTNPVYREASGNE